MKTIQVVLELVYPDESTSTAEQRAIHDIKRMVQGNKHGYAKKVTLTRLERLTCADDRLGNLHKEIG